MVIFDNLVLLDNCYFGLWILPVKEE